MRHLPGEILKHPDNDFKTPSEALHAYKAVDTISVPRTISWAISNETLRMERQSYAGKTLVGTLPDERPRATRHRTRKFSTTGKNYRRPTIFIICARNGFLTATCNKYFNPYDSPYDAYINL